MQSQATNSTYFGNFLRYVDKHRYDGLDEEFVAVEVDIMKQNGHDGICRSNTHYSEFYSSPWAPEYAAEERHKLILTVSVSTMGVQIARKSII